MRNNKITIIEGYKVKFRKSSLVGKEGYKLSEIFLNGERLDEILWNFYGMFVSMREEKLTWGFFLGALVRGRCRPKVSFCHFRVLPVIFEFLYSDHSILCSIWLDTCFFIFWIGQILVKIKIFVYIPFLVNLTLFGTLNFNLKHWI